jgi:hypothetical protein
MSREFNARRFDINPRGSFKDFYNGLLALEFQHLS